MVPWEHVSDLCSICIDEKENDTCKGKLYGQYAAEPFEFQNLDQIILRINEICNMLGTPRTWEEFRGVEAAEINKSFAQTTACVNAAEIREKQGEKCTFWLVILRRQYNSWQGVIWWKERQKEAMFNSVTDLLLLLALASENAHMSCPTKEGSEPYEE